MHSISLNAYTCGITVSHVSHDGTKGTSSAPQCGMGLLMILYSKHKIETYQ